MKRLAAAEAGGSSRAAGAGRQVVEGETHGQRTLAQEGSRRPRAAPETLMMGYGYDPFLSERSLKPPVFHTSTFVFRTAEDGKAFFELAYGLRAKRPNEEPGLIYSRINNPDLEMLEDRLAIWDEAEANLVFASGMAAISTTLWAYARPGSPSFIRVRSTAARTFS